MDNRFTHILVFDYHNYQEPKGFANKTLFRQPAGHTDLFGTEVLDAARQLRLAALAHGDVVGGGQKHGVDGDNRGGRNDTLEL